MFKVNNAIGCPHCGAMLCKADTGIRMVTGQIGGINQEIHVVIWNIQPTR